MKKISLILCFVLLFSTFCFVGCKKKDDLNSLSANLTNYDMTINYDHENKSAQVTEIIDYYNSTDAILKTIKFHLYPQFFEEGAENYIVSSTKLNDAYPNGISYARFEISRVSIADTDTDYSYSGENDSILSVQLKNSLLPENRVEIEIEFYFYLPNCEHRFGYGENTVNLNNFYPIACVYENGDFNCSPYNPNGDPFYSDMANYSIELTLNSSLKVAHTGECISSVTTNNEKVMEIEAKMVRDFALVLSDKFEIISSKAGDTSVYYYYFDDENAENSLNAGVDAINTFNSLFGEYPYSTFSIVKADFVFGGMEYPNLVLISADVENADDYMNVIIHETAHQWWYGMVGNDEYLYPWLDEALTEFSTLLFYNENDGYNLNYAQMVDACRANYTLFISVYTDVLGNLDTSMRAVDEYNTEPEYTYCTYVKGVLMYDSLYSLIGEKKFISALSSYFDANKYTNATPDDLISAFSSANNSDMTNFFDSWISGKVVIR